MKQRKLTFIFLGIQNSQTSLTPPPPPPPLSLAKKKRSILGKLFTGAQEIAKQASSTDVRETEGEKENISIKRHPSKASIVEDTDKPKPLNIPDAPPLKLKPGKKLPTKIDSESSSDCSPRRMKSTEDLFGDILGEIEEIGADCDLSARRPRSNAQQFDLETARHIQSMNEIPVPPPLKMNEKKKSKHQKPKIENSTSLIDLKSQKEDYLKDIESTSNEPNNRAEATKCLERKLGQKNLGMREFLMKDIQLMNSDEEKDNDDAIVTVSSPKPSRVKKSKKPKKKGDNNDNSLEEDDLSCSTKESSTTTSINNPGNSSPINNNIPETPSPKNIKKRKSSEIAQTPPKKQRSSSNHIIETSETVSESGLDSTEDSSVGCPTKIPTLSQIEDLARDTSKVKRSPRNKSRKARRKRDTPIDTSITSPTQNKKSKKEKRGRNSSNSQQSTKDSSKRNSSKLVEVQNLHDHNTSGLSDDSSGSNVSRSSTIESLLEILNENTNETSNVSTTNDNNNNNNTCNNNDSDNILTENNDEEEIPPTDAEEDEALIDTNCVDDTSSTEKISNSPTKPESKETIISEEPKSDNNNDSNKTADTKIAEDIKEEDVSTRVNTENIVNDANNIPIPIPVPPLSKFAVKTDDDSPKLQFSQIISKFKNLESEAPKIDSGRSTPTSTRPTFKARKTDPPPPNIDLFTTSSSSEHKLQSAASQPVISTQHSSVESEPTDVSNIIRRFSNAHSTIDAVPKQYRGTSLSSPNNDTSSS